MSSNDSLKFDLDFLSDQKKAVSADDAQLQEGLTVDELKEERRSDEKNTNADSKNIYVLSRGGKKYNASKDDLLQWARMNKVLPDDTVWVPEENSWVLAKKCRFLVFGYILRKNGADYYANHFELIKWCKENRINSHDRIFDIGNQKWMDAKRVQIIKYLF